MQAMIDKSFFIWFKVKRFYDNKNELYMYSEIEHQIKHPEIYYSLLIFLNTHSILLMLNLIKIFYEQVLIYNYCKYENQIQIS